MSQTHPPIAALTGTIGSGKSIAADIFRKLGAHIIDADLLARKAVEPGQPALSEVVKKFGPSILFSDGTLDRKKLGKIIFADSIQRGELEAVVHPEIRKLFIKELDSIQRASPEAPLILYVIPLLFETGSRHPEIQKIITVSAPREVCISRIMERDRCTYALAEQKINSQIPAEEKEKLSDFVINNNSTVKNLEEQVKDIYAKLTVNT